MSATGQPGVYRSEQPVPVDGRWKTVLRMDWAGEMMALPVYLPADGAIAKAEIPAADRTASFESERRYLLRETHDANRWLSPLGMPSSPWCAGRGRSRSPPRRGPDPRPAIRGVVGSARNPVRPSPADLSGSLRGAPPRGCPRLPP